MNKRIYISLCLVFILVLFSGMMLSYYPVSAVGTTFTVDSVTDLSDNNPGDCICQTSSGNCTLRAAIEEANACSGQQTINFSPSSTPMIIQPSTEFPPLTDDHTIIYAYGLIADLNTWFRPMVIIDGQSVIEDGFTIHSSLNEIVGLTIMGFQRYGILIENGASENSVRYNVVSANGATGIRIQDTGSNNNVIYYNKVGLDPHIYSTLHPADFWGNSNHGISVWDGEGNEILTNWVANNLWSGITFDNVPSGTAKYNNIGFEKDRLPAGNDYYGIHIGNNAQNVEISYNTIDYNRRGVYVTGNSQNINIHNNNISNNDNQVDEGGGIAVNSNSQVTIESNYIASNSAIRGGGIYIGSGAVASIANNNIYYNNAVSDSGEKVYGGGIAIVSATSTTINENTVYNNTASSSDTSTPPATTWAHGGGIYALQVPSLQIETNIINENTISADKGRGAGVSIDECSTLHITSNQVKNNTSSTSDADGAGINVYYTNSELVINRNWFSGNQTQPGAALGVEYSTNVEITNNVIVENSSIGIYLNMNNDPTQLIHNTIAENSGDGIYNAKSYLEFYNNIIASNSGLGLKDEDLTSEIHQYDNDVWNNTGPSNLMMIFDFTVDPLFINPANDQYGLQYNSPLIDQANAALSTTDSYSGIARPQGAGPDIGAYELGYLYLPLLKH